jgi:hypothetical protein
LRAKMGRRRSANFRERTPADSPNPPETHQSLQPHLAPPGGRHSARSKLSTREPLLLSLGSFRHVQPLKHYSRRVHAGDRLRLQGGWHTCVFVPARRQRRGCRVRHSAARRNHGDPKLRNAQYQIIARILYGGAGEAVAAAAVILQQIGACIVRVIIVADVLQPILALSGIQLLCSRALLQALVVVFVIFPLCMLRRMDSLRFTSLAAGT